MRGQAAQPSLSASPSSSIHAALLSAGITNPKQAKDPSKNFTFDYSYWSHTSVSELGWEGELLGGGGGVRAQPGPRSCRCSRWAGDGLSLLAAGGGGWCPGQRRQGGSCSPQGPLAIAAFLS